MGDTDMTDNYTTVSMDTFFATVGKLNVHPRSEPDASYWETPRRECLGITTPGYMGAGEKTYRVRNDILAEYTT